MLKYTKNTLSLLLLLSTFGCFDFEGKIPGLNDCPSKLNLKGLSCNHDQNSNIRAQSLVESLTTCNINKTDKLLPQQLYKDCRNRIIDAFTELSELNDSTCEERFVEPTRCVLRSILLREAETSILPDHGNEAGAQVTGKLNEKKLSSYIEALRDWYDGTLKTIYLSDSQRRVQSTRLQFDKTTLSRKKQEKLVLWELLDLDQREIVDNFWAQVLKSSKSDDLLSRELDFNSQNQASLQVAKAVVSKKHFPAPLLLRILGESTKTLSERFGYLSKIADLGCHFSSCFGKNMDSEIFQTISLFASLGNQEDFNNSYRNSNRVNPDILQLFDAIYRNQDTIDKSLKTFHKLYSESQFGEFDFDRITSAPRFARDMLEIVQSNRLLRDSYWKFGFYSQSSNNKIEFAFSSNLNNIGPLLSYSRQNFEDRWQQFRDNRTRYGYQVISQKSWKNTVDHLTREAGAQLEKIGELEEDLKGLKYSLSEAHLRTAEYFKNAFQTLESKSYLDRYGEVYSTVRTYKPFKIAEGSAPAEMNSTLIRDLAVKSLSPFSLEKGQLALMQIEGAWSPTCALKRSGFADNSVTGAMTGPEGFTLTNFNGKGVVESVTNFERHESSSRKESVTSLCATAGAGIPDILPIFGGVSLSTCANLAFGQTDTRGSSIDTIESTENRQQASFSLGIKTSQAPFPKFPAGSLLFALVPRGEQFRFSEIKSMQVAQRFNQVIADEDSDLYFFVNDCNDGQSSATPGLQVNLEIKAAAKNESKKVVRAMIKSTKLLKNEIDLVLSQGEVSAQQLQTLRQQMQAKLASEGTAATDLDPILSRFYSFWMDNELLELEKRSRIRALERRVEFELSNLGRIESDRTKTTALERPYELQTLWALDSVDTRSMRDLLKSSIDRLNQYIIPAISFQSPRRMKAMKSMRSVQELQEMGSNTSLENIAKTISQLYHDLVDTEKLDNVSSSGWNKEEDIIVSFIDPEILNGTAIKDNFREKSSPFKQGDRVLGNRIWQAFKGNTEESSVEVTLRPEDLYSFGEKDYAQNQLSCQDFSPVIRSMGLFFKYAKSFGDGTENFSHSIPIQASGIQPFLTESGILTFELVGEDSAAEWLNPTIPVAIGNLDTLEQFISKASSKGRAAGLSPLTTFKIDFGKIRRRGSSDLRSTMSEVNEILVVFRLGYRNSGSTKAGWLPGC